MTWIDWVIVAILFFTALHGLRRGVVVALIGAIGVVAAYLLASFWYGSLAMVLSDGVHLPKPWAGTLAYSALFLGVYVFIGTLAAVLLNSASLSVPSRLLGLMTGIVKGGLLAAVLLGLTLASPFGDQATQDAGRSALAPYALRLQRNGAQSLARVLPGRFRPFGAGDIRF